MEKTTSKIGTPTEFTPYFNIDFNRMRPYA